MVTDEFTENKELMASALPYTCRIRITRFEAQSTEEGSHFKPVPQESFAEEMESCFAERLQCHIVHLPGWAHF